jgi:adenine phosphoribosyltransferase
VTETYLARMGSQEIELPLVEFGPGVHGALLMTIDQPVSVIERASAELAALLADRGVETVVTAATLGIPVAAGVAKALGIDRYVVLQKSRKWHLRESPFVELTSITTMNAQRLTLDAARLGEIRGRRVAFVDDVISSGGSAAAAQGLLTDHGAEIVAVAALMTEGDEWRGRLGAHAALVQALGRLPSGADLPSPAEPAPTEPASAPQPLP